MDPIVNRLCSGGLFRNFQDVENVIARAAFPIKWFVLDAAAMVDIDTTGEQTLHQVASRLGKRGVTLALSRVNQQTPSLLEQYQLLPLIGKNRLYPTNRHAIAAFRQETKLPNSQSARE